MLILPDKKTLTLVLVTVLTQSSFSQLCTGSLGDPVAWISFGTSGGPVLSASNTNYTYVNSRCPNDGEYTLTDITFSCFGSSWHTLVGDHTPDDNIGRYMLVKASESPGDFFRDTINGLCGNTSYELSTWIINMLKTAACGTPILPNLTFHVETISGLQLVNYNSGDIPMSATPVWQQFGTFFSTPNNITSVVIRITNNAPGGCGNDLALDDITLRPCGPTVDASLALNGSNTYTICQANETAYLLTGSFSNSYTNPSLQWQVSNDNGATWTNIAGATTSTYLRQPTQEGYFKYRLTIAEGNNIFIPQCRIASSPVTIIISPPPFVQATNYVFSCYGSTVLLFASGGSIYEWTGPNDFTSKEQEPQIPNVQFTDAGLYKVKVTTFFGCSNYDSTRLQVYPAAHASISSDVSICEGGTTQLNASGGIKYFWDPANGLSDKSIANPIASPKDSILYKVYVMNEYNCSDTAGVRVNVWKKPSANAGPDLKMLINRPVILKGAAGGTQVSYDWIPNLYMKQSNTLSPQVNPPQTMSYRLQVISTLGCGNTTDDVIVKVYDKIQIPNVFSPNGDGINDKWDIELLKESFPECTINVYNRYGQIIFHSTGYDKPWDGTFQNKPVPIGTYYYIVDLKNNIQKIAGFVDVLR
jgi:gliding motility-associated-like protein